MTDPAGVQPTADELGTLIRTAGRRLPRSRPEPDRLAAARSRHRGRRATRRVGLAATLAVAAAAVAAVAALPGNGAPSRVATAGGGPTAGFPALGPGGSCPATPEHPAHTPLGDGEEAGAGPVRMMINNVGDPAHGVVDIGRSDGHNPLGPAGYYAFQDYWYSLPSYRATWTVTARRLDGPGQVLLNNSSPTPAPQSVPAGPSQESGGGYRSGVGSTWVPGPGCYGFRVQGPHLHETVVLEVVFGP